MIIARAPGRTKSGFNRLSAAALHPLHVPVHAGGEPVAQRRCGVGGNRREANLIEAQGFEAATKFSLFLRVCHSERSEESNGSEYRHLRVRVDSSLRSE
jgi:hypothetical protein